jgi:hypothetical protein
LNDHYRRIINRANRLKKLAELNAPPVILLNERHELQRTADQLWANCLLPEEDATVDDQGRLLKDLATVGLARLATEISKRVDWSASARLVSDSSLPTNVVSLPQSMFETLRLQSGEIVLLTLPQSAAFVAARAQNSSENLIRVPPQLAARLGQFSSEIPIVNVHRPIRAEAIAEAQRLLDDVSAQSPVPHDPPILLADDELVAGELLAHAAARGETIPLNGPRGLLLSGGRAAEFHRDTFAAAKAKSELREVPAPAEITPKFSQPTFEQIHAVIQSSRRRACHFVPRPESGKLPPLAGRIGGLPCLPPTVAWPYSKGKPLPFLAQLPLDPLLQILGSPQFPPGSLLTIFWGHDWWTANSAGATGPVLVVSGADLAEREAPPGEQLLIPQCALDPEWVDEVPDWQELRELLNFELENPEPGILKRFQTTEWQQYPVADDAVRVGGWPHWIQSPEGAGTFIAQLSSADHTELNFGDSGSLYISVTEERALSVVMQCY